MQAYERRTMTIVEEIRSIRHFFGSSRVKSILSTALSQVEMAQLAEKEDTISNM